MTCCGQKNIDPKIVECLEQCVKRSELETFPWMTEPAYTQYSQSLRDGTHAIERNYVYETRLKPDEEHCKNLARLIQPLLINYVDPKHDWIGDGLQQIIGRNDAPIVYDLESFAHRLIFTAHKVGVARAIDLLLDITNCNPLDYRIRAFINGVNVTQELNVNEGVTLSPVQYSPSELNDMHAGLADMFPLFTRSSCAMISIDCQATPVFYRPEINKHGTKISGFNPTIAIPKQFLNRSLGEFCESLSLACNHPIEVFVKWHDLGAMKEFVEPAVRHEVGTWIYRKPVEIGQDDWNEAVNIHHNRFKKNGKFDTLNIPLKRWISSKTTPSSEDKLIELRIGLEALYELKGQTEKSFRLALYSARHLGKNPQERHQIFDTVRKFYNTASNVVHAGTPTVPREDLISEVQDLCRQGILKRLQETNNFNWMDLILGKKT